MSSVKKGILKSLLSRLLDSYNYLTNIQKKDEGYIHFARCMANIFEFYYGNVTCGPDVHRIYGREADTIYGFYFLNNPPLNNECPSELTTGRHDYKNFLKLFSSLHFCIKKGHRKLFRVNEQTTTSKITYKEIGQGLRDSAAEEVKTEYTIDRERFKNNALTTDIYDENDDFFLNAITLGATSFNDDHAIVEDFFDRKTHTTSFDWARNVLLCYHIYYGSFESLKLCKNCDNIHLPERSGFDRGIFCSSKCQKSYFNSKHRSLVNCKTNQRNWIERVAKKCGYSEIISAIVDGIEMPSIDKCRRCAATKRLKVKAGECPVLNEDVNFIELRNRLSANKNSAKTSL